MKKGQTVIITKNRHRAYVIKGTRNPDGLIIVWDFDARCDYSICACEVEEA